jgi:hypothetical protein
VSCKSEAAVGLFRVLVCSYQLYGLIATLKSFTGFSSMAGPSESESAEG